MKPKYHTATLRYHAIGASLVTAITLCLAGSACATDWSGVTSTDWNDNSNWVGGAGTGGSHAVINTSVPNAATISADIVAAPIDIFVATGATTNAVLNHTAGTAGTGPGNWMFVGQNGGIGTYNLADTNILGGGVSGYALGSGIMNVGGRLYVGGWGSGGSLGTVNVNTTGTLNIPSMLQVGEGGSAGILNLESGTVTTGGGWVEFGNGANSNGTLTMTGGALTKNGGDHFIIASNGGTGLANLSGGTLTVNNEIWVGQNNATGTLNLSGTGKIANNSWVAVGRDLGKGTFTMTGGTWTKTGGGNFIIGASGPGTMTQSGGLVDVQGGETWIAETRSCTGTLTLSGTAEFRTPLFSVARDGGTNGTLNLDGGTVRTGQFIGGNGTKTLSFNGTQIIATASQAAFVSNFNTATINSGGMLLDSNGFNPTIPQVLGGTGGVVKTGNGTLSLTGANSFSGANTISAGTLVTRTTATGSGAYTLADAATWGITQMAPGQSLIVPGATFGGSAASTLNIDLGNAAGIPTAAPLTVTGALTANGPVTINIADALPAVGTFPLITYAGPKAGSGSFTLGTLPLGVVATLSDDGTSAVSLNVTTASLLVWKGSTDETWDIASTPNWVDKFTTLASTYTDPAGVMFDDTVTGTGLVSLGVSVAPSTVTFNNPTIAYFLSGAGKITGSAPLVKQGAAALSITTANDYTGTTTLAGGTTSVNSLANGGSPSSIGASSADPANLILSGGTLRYTGASTSIDRGFTVAAANSGTNIANNLTLSGPVVSTGGSLLKTGAGNLTLTNPGANVLSNAGYPALRVDGGVLTLEGGGSQTNSVVGEMWIGSAVGVPAALVLNNSSLTTSSWIALGRGNGSTGVLSSITATSSTIQSSNFSTGYNAGLDLNDTDQTVALIDTTWTNTGVTLIAESINAITTMTLSGTSVFSSSGEFLMGLGAGSTANVTVEGNASVTKTAGSLTIGGRGVATLTLKDSATFTSTAGDINIGDLGTAQGTFNISGSAVFSTGNNAFVGKNSGTSGTVNQTGGTFNGSEYIAIGRYAGSTGVYDISGGAFNQVTDGRAVLVGEEGTGILNISGTGAVNVSGNLLYVSNAATGTGTVNLNGGTLTTKQVSAGAGGAGLATFNFNGGLLKAGTGANADFMSLLDTVSIRASGAFIDSNGNNIGINQNISDDATNGTLTKSGTGALYLNGVNTYAGTTQVNEGTLGGTGTIPGALVIAAGADLNPGVTTGTLSVGSVTFAGPATLTIDVAEAGDTLAVANSLDLTHATLVLNGTPTLPLYVIASYGTLTGTFPPLTLPPGYAIDYNYNGNKRIAITGPAGGYGPWIDGYFPGETDPSIIGATADPDGDGQSNVLEFALGGVPNSGADNAKIYSMAADSDADPDASKELLMTIAVLSGTPAFSAGPAPSATQGEVTYTVVGSTTLGSFGDAATPVGVVVPPAPNATPPTGYEYRTFSLDGSNGLPTTGFLRVSITH